MISSRDSTKRQEEPCALEVAKLRNLVQETRFVINALLTMCGYELFVAEWSAKNLDAPLDVLSSACPDFWAEVFKAWRTSTSILRPKAQITMVSSNSGALRYGGSWRPRRRTGWSYHGDCGAWQT